MKTLTLLLTLILAVAGAQAQSESQSQSSGWKLYTAKDDKFSVALPNHPFMRTLKEKRQPPEKDRRRLLLGTSVSGVIYTIHSVDNPKRQQSFDAFVQEQIASRNPGWDLASARNLDLNGITGKAFVSSDGKGMAQLFATEDRLYDFRAYGAPLDDARMTMFFSSLSFKKNDDSIEVFDGPGSFFESDPGDIYKGRDVDSKVVVRSKPEPEYTSIGVSGRVVLRCVFTSKGTVTHIYVIKGLRGGLTESAMQAARQIQFTPAMKDGKPVSMWMQLQYNFYN